MSNTPQTRHDAGAGGVPMSPLLTEHDVAERLAVSIKTVQRWRLFNQGPPYKKLGSKLRSAVRYRVDEVERWLEEQPTGGAPAHREHST